MSCFNPVISAEYSPLRFHRTYDGILSSVDLTTETPFLLPFPHLPNQQRSLSFFKIDFIQHRRSIHLSDHTMGLSNSEIPSVCAVASM